jgi:ribosomal protein S12 methylthiotransferase accessory factor
MNLLGEEVAARKGYHRGTHRSVAPAETLCRFGTRLREFGITRIADITGLDCIGLPVYVAVRPNSRNLSTAQGKGIDHDSAKASAMMESIESWHAERPPLPLVHDSYRSLRRTHDAVDPGALPAAPGQMPRPDVPYFWARGWDLLSEQWTHVPYEAVTLNFVFPPTYRPTFRVSSNGLASGNHVLEATVHAICEVIERDAQALWSLRWAGARTPPAVDLTTVDDESCRHVLSLLERAGVTAIAWDITSDTGVPAYSCQIVERPDTARWRTIGPAGGHGCHLSPAVALLRALTEAVQSRLTLVSGSRDDAFYRSYEAFGDRDNLERAWRRIARTEERQRFPSRARLDTATFDEDLRTVVQRLRAIGISSAVVVDLSRPPVGIPVVKVVVPGLEGHRAGIGYRPGVRAARVANELADGQPRVRSS